MKHPVKCVCCGQQFDRATEEYVEVSSRRYAHKSCAKSLPTMPDKSVKDYDRLVAYAKKLLGEDYVQIKVAKQIKEFRETYGYTYSGMLGSLIYWFEVRQATKDKANGGIGIIPYVYNQAKEYFTKLEVASNFNKDIKDYKAKIIEISMLPPQSKVRQPKLFKFEDEV